MMENNRLNSSNTNLFWHRRDLRIEDNSGLFKALTSGQKIQAVFIFDSNILNLLSDKEDARITFIYRTLHFAPRLLYLISMREVLGYK